MAKHFTFPPEILSQHIAALGKTGSGKTSTAKLIVEQVVASGARVCVLDPIKSDWWGLTSSVDGKRAGLPFHILGGPRGHVPLHASAGKAIAEIVANGSLPLSIIDMADFEPGGQAKFFTEFAPKLLQKMRGVVYLVIEEAHLFAPKERSGIGAENLSIHWAKTLATAGRSKGIRLILATQRTQALHNALLGSCDTMIAHRLTAPADQAPVIDWLKANTSKDVMQQVASSLASLKTGSAWLCSGEAKRFEVVDFPRISTYDNTATPTGDGDTREIKTAAVDRNKLEAIIGQAVVQAKANDPKELKRLLAAKDKRISELEADVKVQRTSLHPAPGKPTPVLTDADRALVAKLNDMLLQVRERALSTPSTMDIEAAFARVVTRELQARDRSHAQLREAFLEAFESANVKKLLAKLEQISAPPADGVSKPPYNISSPRQSVTALLPRPAVQGNNQTTRPNDCVTPAKQRILNALAFFEGIGLPKVGKVQLALMADASPGSGAFNNNLGAMRTAGLIEYPSPGDVALTDAGAAVASVNGAPTSTDELQSMIRSKLPPAKWRIVQALIDAYPDALPKDELANRAQASPGSGAFNNNLGSLRSLGLIDYPRPGHAVAKSVLFLEGR